MRPSRSWPPRSPAPCATWTRPASSAAPLPSFWRSFLTPTSPEPPTPRIESSQPAELAGYPDPQVTDLLREVDYGQYEGLTSKEIHQFNPSWEVYADGSPQGETPAQIYARAQQFIVFAGKPGGRVLAFAHGHILRAIAAAWIRADVKVASGLMLDVATLGVLRDDGHRLITRWNAPP